MWMMAKIMRSCLGLTTVLAVLTACHSSEPRGANSRLAEAQENESFFPLAIPAFDRLRSQSGGNHPQSYAASALDGSLFTEFVGTYGTEQSFIHLDLQTGTIDMRRKSANPTVAEVQSLLPPSQGGSYFAYQEALQSMKEVLAQVGAGAAEEALSRLLTAIRDQDSADEIRLANSALPLVLSQKLHVNVDFKVKPNRELMASVCDSSQCYTTERFGFPGATGLLQLDLASPSAMQNLDTAYLSLKIVPAGAEWTSKVFEINKVLKAEVFAKVQAYAPYQQTLGSQGSIYLVYRAREPSQLLYRWVDAQGRTVSEGMQALAASPENGLPGNTSVAYSLPLDAAPGAALLWVRLIGKDGSWDRFDAEFKGSSTFVAP